MKLVHFFELVFCMLWGNLIENISEIETIDTIKNGPNTKTTKATTNS